MAGAHEPTNEDFDRLVKDGETRIEQIQTCRNNSTGKVYQRKMTKTFKIK